MTSQNTPSTAPQNAADDTMSKPPSPFMETWNYFRKNRGAYVGLIVIAIILFVAAFATFISPYDPIMQDRSAFLKPPIWMEGADPRYILGTDAVGRDILSRLIHGAQLSVSIGVFVVIISMVAGIMLGVTAGYFRGWIEVAIMRMMDTMLAYLEYDSFEPAPSKGSIVADESHADSQYSPQRSRTGMPSSSQVMGEEKDTRVTYDESPGQNSNNNNQSGHELEDPSNFQTVNFYRRQFREKLMMSVRNHRRLS